MVRHGVSCAVGISPSMSVPRIEGLNLVNAPLAFDFSHTDHVTTQKGMWGRVLRITDGLISLLKSQPLDDTVPGGETLWDRSLVYIATDFGRSKVRPTDAGQFSTGHHINNGNVILSPLINGNRVYGGVDDATCTTFGFDPVTGDPDPSVNMSEGDIYSAICHALDVNFSGRRDFPSFVRA